MATYIRIGEPRNEAERIGIRTLREKLPDHYMVIGNFELSLPRRANSLEFDAVVIGEHGLYAVEIKGWLGTITGNPRRWFLEWGPVENPFIRTDQKSKALRDFLVKQIGSFPDDVFVEPVVFLPYAAQLKLDEPRQSKVIDPDEVWDFFVDIERIRERGPGPFLEPEFRTAVHDALIPWAKPSRNRVILPQYEVIAKLETEGTNAEYIARHTMIRGRSRVRVKEYRLDPLSNSEVMAKLMKQVMREMEALASLEDNPYVARGYEVHRDADDHHVVYLIMEYVGSHTLADVIQAVHRDEDPMEYDLNLLAQHLLRALSFIHEEGITHRELGPACIHMRKDEDGPPFKIVDFDHARVSHVSSIGSDLGSLGAVGYTAPEMWMTEDHDHRVDFFSAGAILYELFTGDRLFGGIPELMDPTPVWERKKQKLDDDELCEVIGSLVAVDPNDRPDDLRQISDFFGARIAAS